MKPNQPTKRVDIVSVKLVKEGSVRYKGRTIHRPDDGYSLMKKIGWARSGAFPRRQPRHEESARLRQRLPYRESEREPRPSERGVEGRDLIERGRRDGRA